MITNNDSLSLKRLLLIKLRATGNYPNTIKELEKVGNEVELEAFMRKLKLFLVKIGGFR